MLDETVVRKGRKSKRQKQLEEFNNKYPIGWLNRSQLLEKVDDAYISMRNDELVSIGPRLTPSALEAIEWFETEYAYLPIYLILDALKYIEGYNGEPYDVIYADPPFPMKGKEEMLTLVGDNGSILKKNGYFIIHIPEEDVKLWADEYKGLKHWDLRHYGRSKLIFYKKQE